MYLSFPIARKHAQQLIHIASVTLKGNLIRVAVIFV